MVRGRARPGAGRRRFAALAHRLVGARLQVMRRHRPRIQRSPPSGPPKAPQRGLSVTDRARWTYALPSRNAAKTRTGRTASSATTAAKPDRQPEAAGEHAKAQAARPPSPSACRPAERRRGLPAATCAARNGEREQADRGQAGDLPDPVDRALADQHRPGGGGPGMPTACRLLAAGSIRRARADSRKGPAQEQQEQPEADPRRARSEARTPGCAGILHRLRLVLRIDVVVKRIVVSSDSQQGALSNSSIATRQRSGSAVRRRSQAASSSGWSSCIELAELVPFVMAPRR